MNPIAPLDQALEAYRKALYRTPSGGTPPDPSSFADDLSPADRSSFFLAAQSAVAFAVTAEFSPPAPKPDQTLDSDPSARPDQTGEFNKETKSILGETPDPNRVTTTKQVGRYFSSGQGDFETGEPASRSGVGDRLDDYEILGELGHGGMGVVYKARQKALNRVCALKMVLAGGRATVQQLARFTAEAKAVAKLDHPNIVRIYDIGEHDSLPFFSMEFVDGGPLDSTLKKKSLEPKAAARLVETVCRAMHYAHEKGIIHRDLKPANILLTSGSNPTPKITDFGLAKQLDEEADGGTRTGAVMGTPNYMAPEQAEGMTKDVTPLADVYSLGATLYELLTGRPPFQGPSAVAVLAQVRSNEPVNPSRLQPGVPKDLETICLKAMQKEPFKRYVSAESMADDLKRYLDGQPIHARPISSVEYFVRWCKRKPAQAGLAVTTAALAVALVVSGIAYGANLRHKNTVIEGQKRDLETANVALVREKEEVIERGEALAKNFRFLIRNTAGDLKLLNLPKQREALVNFILNDLKRVEGLPGDSAGVDDRVRVGVYLNLGEIYLESASGSAGERRKENLEKAEEEFDKAVALTEKLAASKPTSDLAQGLWALALARRADFRAATGKAPEFAVDADKAFRLRKSIADSPQSPPGTRDHLFPADRISSLAESYLQLCGLKEVREDKAKYAAYLKEVQSLNEAALKMVEDDPKSTEEPTGALIFRRRLGNAYATLALRTGGAERKAYWEKAKAIRERISADEPDSLPDRAVLADTVGRLGNVALFAGDYKTAADLYSQKAAHLAKVVSPQDTRRQWGMTYYQVATAQLLAGDRKAALNTFRKSVAARDELARDSDRPQDAWGLMVSLARCAEFDRAVEVLKAADPQLPDFQYNAACTYSILAGELGGGAADDKLPPDLLMKRKEYLDKAWEHLGKAYALKSNQLNDMAVDPDLAYLRTREDYTKKLELAKASK